MKIEQIYTGCLAQGAYYIENNGEAAIVDPLRDVQAYISRAEKSNAKIKYVLETHFHADFVSGHLDLASQTGATIVYGPTAQPSFDALVATDNQILTLGNATIKVLHTPGHTLESACFLLIDENGKEQALFSGDTLFIGDVGRPDLAQKAANMTQEGLAGLLFDSLRNKIMNLPKDIIVYPGHGAGSACGKMMSKETMDSLGHQLETNYALQASMSKDEFIVAVTNGLTPPPAYFPMNVMMNKLGYDSINNVMNRSMRPLSVSEFEVLTEEPSVLILDTRKAQDFAKGFIPNSINIGIDGSFAPWVGALIPDVKQEIIIIAEPGREEEVITRLTRVGFDYCLGFLNGGIESWIEAQKPLDAIESISVDALTERLNNSKGLILDVRKKSEYDSEHVMNAINAPLDYVNESMLLVQKDKTYFVHCASGYRSMVFVSILKARGYNNLIEVKGGFKAIKESEKFPITEYVCPSTLL